MNHERKLPHTNKLINSALDLLSDSELEAQIESYQQIHPQLILQQILELIEQKLAETLTVALPMPEHDGQGNIYFCSNKNYCICDFFDGTQDEERTCQPYYKSFIPHYKSHAVSVADYSSETAYIVLLHSNKQPQQIGDRFTSARECDLFLNTLVQPPLSAYSELERVGGCTWLVQCAVLLMMFFMMANLIVFFVGTMKLV